MSDKDLKSFKISDQSRPQVKQAVDKKSAPAPAGPPPSVGFPRIEALVEQEAPDLSALVHRQAQLAALAKDGSSNKEKAAAKKAAAAYEKAQALVSYLMETKKRLAG